MKTVLPLVCIAALLLGGCGIQVVPRPTAATTLNTADNSLTQTTRGVAISARVQDREVVPYQLADNITSFYLTIRNRTSDTVTIPLESFVLVDSQGHQIRPIAPTQIQGIVSRNSEYLIPYPYVGFYYLEDYERYSFFNTFNSALPYYAENHPQDLFIRALPVTPILPGAFISGEIFFLVDLALKEAVELRTYLPGTPETAPADYLFPFSIVK